jgi:hypothetical protein
MADLSQLFATAARLAAEGQTDQAMQTYREIVRAEPSHATRISILRCCTVGVICR